LLVVLGGLAGFVGLTIIGGGEHIISTGGIALSGIISFNFVFGAVLGEGFRSIVFIFLVRPFDIGDRLMIDGKVHIVLDMGLLYSTFLINKEVHNIQNIRIMEKSIINYRKSTRSEKCYSFIFHLSDFKTKREELRLRIQETLDRHPKVYMRDFDISNYECLQGERIRVEIRVVISIYYQNIKALRMNEDQLTVAISEILDDLKLRVL
jgi:small-conductance mechanosensitive channel